MLPSILFIVKLRHVGYIVDSHPKDLVRHFISDSICFVSNLVDISRDKFSLTQD